MSIEIEVKARVDDLEAVARALEAHGCTISPAATQDDTLFINFDGEYTDWQRPEVHVVRIRKSGGKVLLTYKKPQSNQLDCIEYETEISNPEDMGAMLLSMGYREAMRYKKTRRKTKLQGCEICLDDVEGLGTLVEMEKLAENADSEAVQEELFDTLETFGIKRENRVREGYDVLLYLKEHGRKA